MTPDEEEIEALRKQIVESGRLLAQLIVNQLIVEEKLGLSKPDERSE